MRLGLRDANQGFSKAIKAVRAGEDVVLTDRGRPIAVIRPLRKADGPEAVLQAMADAGLIQRASRKGPMPPPRWRPLKVKGKPLSDTIAGDREDRA